MTPARPPPAAVIAANAEAVAVDTGPSRAMSATRATIAIPAGPRAFNTPTTVVNAPANSSSVPTAPATAGPPIVWKNPLRAGRGRSERAPELGR